MRAAIAFHANFQSNHFLSIERTKMKERDKETNLSIEWSNFSKSIFCFNKNSSQFAICNFQSDIICLFNAFSFACNNLALMTSSSPTVSLVKWVKSTYLPMVSLKFCKQVGIKSLHLPNQRLLTEEGSITVRMVSSLTDLDSTALLHTNGCRFYSLV